MIFEGLSGALVAAVLRSSMRPTGAENTMILKRVLERIRRHFPDPHILVRGDGHFSTPELMDCIDAMANTDFVFGMARNKVLDRLGEPAMVRARRCSCLTNSTTLPAVGAARAKHLLSTPRPASRERATHPF